MDSEGSRDQKVFYFISFESSTILKNFFKLDCDSSQASSRPEFPGSSESEENILNAIKVRKNFVETILWTTVDIKTKA